MKAIARRDFLKAGFMAGVALWAGRGAAADKDRPNIVFILSDDHGLDGVGCYGSDRHKDRTPNLDALAAGGIRFERCYSTPLCGPTRCQIMTGRYPFRTGGLTNGSAGQPKATDEVPLARILKEAGYATCHVGKWRQVGGTPADWGFQDYVTDPTAGGYFWEKTCTRNGETVDLKGRYYPDFCHDHALEFVRKNKDKPFFLYYASHLVHGPILRTPDTKPGTTDPNGLYNDNIAYLDKQVGEVVAELDKLGLREKTVIVFSGDNGTAGRSGTIGGRQINGQKATMLEGGSRVPLIANWKGTAPAGKVHADLIDFSDILPTFTDLAGAKPPESMKYDGLSFAPRLRGAGFTPREWIYVQLGRKWYARNDGWKLTESGDLFDMKDAPFVEAPVAADTKDDAAVAARKRLQAVLAELNPAGGRTISEADVAVEKERFRKRLQKKKAR